MSHKNKLSLTKQVTDTLLDKLRIGQPKFEAKKDGSYREGIYSYETYHAYTKHCLAFAKYCKEQHRCKTLAECRDYVNEYLESRSSLSSYTIKLDAAALGKLFGCSTDEFVSTQPRLRANISRSRREAVRDKHFSESNHAVLVAFCRSTGLRRHELAALRGDDRKEENGTLFIHVRRGKGGKERWVRVIGDVELVKKLMDTAGYEKVFPKISSAADIHSYRRQYARAYYDQIARPIKDIPPSDRYYCRRDLAGVVYDKKAMLLVSRALGHERICVIASNYLS